VGFTTFGDSGQGGAPVVELVNTHTGENWTLQGITNQYTDPGAPKMVHFMSFVRLSPLVSATTYRYRVRSGDSQCVWSDYYSFTTRDYAGTGTVQYSVFGDMGTYSYNNMELLEEDLDSGITSLVIHLGDHAYQMSSGEGTGTRGVRFLFVSTQ
jgi:hypothetical protein